MSGVFVVEMRIHAICPGENAFHCQSWSAASAAFPSMPQSAAKLKRMPSPAGAAGCHCGTFAAFAADRQAAATSVQPSVDHPCCLRTISSTG